MRILFTCADKPDISRNLFHRTLLKKYSDYQEVVSDSKSYLGRIPSILARLPLKMFSTDVYYVGYMGHFLVPLIRLFSNKPIVYDFYLSLYDVMCNDRKLFKPNSILGKFTYWIEKRSLHSATHIIVDTQKLIDTLSEEYKLSKDKFTRVPLTINEENIFPHEVAPVNDNFTVLYVGSYIPLHGTEIIIEAAKILQEKNANITILMIGQGPDFKKCEELVNHYNLKNIEFKGFMPLSELNYYYNTCDINLGLFNQGQRANSVILNKTNDAFRVGRPHLTLKTEAMQELFTDNDNIFYIDNIQPSSLAIKILSLKNNPELVQQVGRNALLTYEKKLSNTCASTIIEESILSHYKKKYDT